MKRLILCLFVLIGAAAMSHVDACIGTKKAPQSTVETFVGTYTERSMPECRDDEGNYCPECPIEEWWWLDCLTPAIVVDGKVYFLTGVEWEQKLAEMEVKKGDEIEITGIPFSEYCQDIIEPVNIKRLHAAIDDVHGADAALDLSKPMFNALGQPVDENYQGIVIQNGHKFVR